MARGAVGGVPLLLFLRHTPGMKPPEQGFIGGNILFFLIYLNTKH